jgi:hypothetical protein
MAEQTPLDPVFDAGAKVMGFPAYRERIAALGELHSYPIGFDA